MATKKTKSKYPRKKFTQVNEVPLSSTLQGATDNFLQAVRREKLSDEGPMATALVIIFRPDGNGGVDANVLNWGLADDTQAVSDLAGTMARAALKAISGKPLFYEVG